jgi:hypothetical protein
MTLWEMTENDIVALYPMLQSLNTACLLDSTHYFLVQITYHRERCD